MPKKTRRFIQKLFSSSKKGSTAKKSKEGTPKDSRASTQKQQPSDAHPEKMLADSSALSEPPPPPTPFHDSTIGTFRTLANLSMSPAGVFSAGEMDESAVWVEESVIQPTRSLPGIHNSPAAIELAAQKDAILAKMFPDSCSDLRQGDFNPARYLLENNQSTKLTDLRALLKYLQVAVVRDEQDATEMQESTLNSLIGVVDALSIVHAEMQHRVTEEDWPMTSSLAAKVEETKSAVKDYFREQLEAQTPVAVADQIRDPAKTV